MTYSIPEFIQYLKLSKIFTPKQSLVIEHVCIYFENLKVYKVIVSVDPTMMKKAKKLGIHSQYTTTFFDDIPLKISQNASSERQIANGRYFAMYYPNTGKCTIYTGEDIKICDTL